MTEAEELDQALVRLSNTPEGQKLLKHLDDTWVNPLGWQGDLTGEQALMRVAAARVVINLKQRIEKAKHDPRKPR